ncbi:hypothetical protein B0H17DRAFT_1062685 [Mycena rosella]|uniref:DUF6699 domain-containing protein n=1 Tax=Mycena rosella TaxID=1033263 RepID=A0AAD7GFA3_MYCRO|nr:hypothetical protein B0H17DRAFT_1062685 [Mycena rosella]
MAGRRRDIRGYQSSPWPYGFADLDGYRGPPGSFPQATYVQQWPTQAPWAASNELPPPEWYPPGTFVPQWAKSHWEAANEPPPPEPYPPGTFVPQWAAPQSPWGGNNGPVAPRYPPARPSRRDRGDPFLSPVHEPPTQLAWPGYNGGWPPPQSFPPAYDFAPLENTDRLPRPSDMFPQAFGQSPWGDGLGLPSPGFGPPLGGFSMIDGGEPITPMPMQMNSPFPIPMAFPNSPFPNFSPFPMTPGALGPDVQPILFARKYPYEGENLASRPSDWRHNYQPPRRFRFPRLGGAEIKTNLEHCHLSPLLLMPNAKMPIMSFDLRSDHPFDPLNLELLSTAGRPFNPTDLMQLATTRPVRRLRFYHPRLPWYIDVRASQPNGVLVGDVLHQIHEHLQRSIRPQDFSNSVLDATDRELITDAYRARCDGRVDIMQQGVRRVDFMGSDVILQGFMAGKSGMWLMKTTRFSRNMDG